MDFSAFDTRKIDEYSERAKEQWGKTEAYKEYTQKAQRRSKEQNQAVGEKVMDFFVELGRLRHLSPDAPEVQAWVADLQTYFTEHFYNCTPQILLGLSEGYAGGGSLNENIDAAGGQGTGEFAREAIRIYCSL